MLVTERPRIGAIDDSHSFLHDNPFVIRGYRLHFRSPRQVWKSLLLLHNETFNIWSHLLGLLLFGCLFGYCLFAPDMPAQPLLEELHRTFTSSEEASVNPEDPVASNPYKGFAFKLRLEPPARWPVLIFIVSAILCFACSTTYHLFNCHSPATKSVLVRLDYGGISFLVAGSFYPYVYYLFYCEEQVTWVYLTGISTACGAAFVVAMFPFFQKPRYLTFRGILFLVIGLLGVIPFVHTFFL